METALAAAQAFAMDWQATAQAVAHPLLERAADLLRPIGRADEAGYTRSGQIPAECDCRGARGGDFCRYYAQQMRDQFENRDQAEPLGPVVCISPWNFPLAIFIGEVSAALAAGNVVLGETRRANAADCVRAVSCCTRPVSRARHCNSCPGSGKLSGAR